MTFHIGRDADNDYWLAADDPWTPFIDHDLERGHIPAPHRRGEYVAISDAKAAALEMWVLHCTPSNYLSIGGEHVDQWQRRLEAAWLEAGGS